MGAQPAGGMRPVGTAGQVGAPRAVWQIPSRPVVPQPNAQPRAPFMPAAVAVPTSAAATVVVPVLSPTVLQSSTIPVVPAE